MEKEIYKIIYESTEYFPDKSIVNPFWIYFIITKSFRCRKIYTKLGLNECIEYIMKQCRKSKHIEKLDINTSVYQMRKAMVAHNLICRIFKKSFNCLENSLSLSILLVRLGYDVSLVIGKSTNYVNRFFDFHAWVSFQGQPINDTNQVLEMYIPVFEKKLRVSTDYHLNRDE